MSADIFVGCGDVRRGRSRIGSPREEVTRSKLARDSRGRSTRTVARDLTPPSGRDLDPRVYSAAEGGVGLQVDYTILGTL